MYSPATSTTVTTRVSLPKNWHPVVQAAILKVVALAQYAMAYTYSGAANGSNDRLRETARADRHEQNSALWQEVTRIICKRYESIPAHHRPRYEPTERLAILELRAARHWSLQKTARVFQVTPATIASWEKRLDEEGPDALLQTPEPVNKFPDLVRNVVKRLKTLCPRMGKVKIAQTLARAGLHLAATTVGRIAKEPLASPPELPPKTPTIPKPTTKTRVTAKRPNHVWHVDLTTVPTAGGFWVPWLPFALPQCWPFCWWVVPVLDHYSRRILDFALFKTQPSSAKVRRFLDRAIATAGVAPKYLITDSGAQFTCGKFKTWCKGHGIGHRKGAIGKSGSIAVIERFIRTLKSECTRLLSVVSYVRRAFQRELSLFIEWYNEHRPHDTLKGATPNEVYFKRRQANQAPRFEPRSAYPRGSPCAKPQTLVKGQPGVRLHLDIAFVSGRSHLPRVTLRRAA
jgi:putative transposase